MGWKEALAGISPRRFMNEAAENKWDFKTFIVKASQKGLGNDPEIMAYANILKEEDGLRRGTEQEEQRRGEAVGRREEYDRVMEGTPAIPESRSLQNIPVQQPQMMGETTQLGEFSETDVSTMPPRGPASFTEETYVPGQEAVVPETRRQAYGMTDPNVFQTTEQFEEAGGKYVPTAADLEKERIARQKQDMYEQREKRMSEKEVRLKERKKHDSDVLAFRYYALHYKGKLKKEEIQLKEDALKLSGSRIIGGIKTDIAKANKELAELMKGSENLAGEMEMDWEAIREKNVEITTLEQEKTDADAERKMIGTMADEMRKFSPGGKTTTREAPPAPPPEVPKKAPPAPTSSFPGIGISRMESVIRKSLSSRGVSPDTIEDYIAEKKAKGAL